MILTIITVNANITLIVKGRIYKYFEPKIGDEIVNEPFKISLFFKKIMNDENFPHGG